MDLFTQNITILSDQKVRAKIIQNLILDGLKHQVPVSLIGSEQIQENNKNLDKCLVIADLISIEKPVHQLLREIKECFPGVKIIALHIYRSMVLVEPLFKMGVSGYIFYEPSRQELVQAITSVSTGELYKPEYLVSS